MAEKNAGLDATTLDVSKPGRAVARTPLLQVVFANGEVQADRQLLLKGELLAGRQVPEGGWALPEDAQASRKHAKFSVQGERVVVEDLNSRNGVIVNGRRVPRAELHDGDVVRVGATFGVFRLEDRHQLDVPNPCLIGISSEMRSVRVAVKRLAAEDITVLVLGETGTGKEVVSKALHDASKRDGRYVAVNCAAVQASLFESELFGRVAGAFTGASDATEGYFRAAADGTLLLDEIGDMPLDLQPKLLRALEEGSVVPVGATTPVPHRARVVAATNRDLAKRVDAGGFRDDLYARLAQQLIMLPPLRKRREDILLLLQQRLGVDAPPLAPSLVDALLNFAWPLNVRGLMAVAAELRSKGRGAKRLELDLVRARLDAGEELSNEPTLDGLAQLPPVDAERLEALLRQHAGNVTAVARAVGRSRTQTYRLIEQHGLDPTSFRAS